MKEFILTVAFILTSMFLKWQVHSLYALGIHILVCVSILMWQNRAYKVERLEKEIKWRDETIQESWRLSEHND